MFSLQLKVEQQHIDALQHVNNAVYVKWMEELAKNHWKFLSKNHNTDKYVWVVLRHEIDYKAQAILGDTITGKTWVGESKGFTSERFIEFYCNDKLLVKAKTTWALLFKHNFKPARIREDVLKVLQPSK